MLIESKIKIGHDSMFNICQTNFDTAHLINKMALVQFQRNSTVLSIQMTIRLCFRLSVCPYFCHTLEFHQENSSRSRNVNAYVSWVKKISEITPLGFWSSGLSTQWILSNKIKCDFSPMNDLILMASIK